MSEIKEVSLILSFQELMILLYNRGFRSVQGILMEGTSFSEEEVLYSLLSLSRRGLIQAEEDRFIIREDLCQALDIMGSPASYFEVQRPAPMSEPVYCCYVAVGKIVVTELYRRKKTSVRIRWFEPQDFFDWKEEIENDYY